MASGHPDILAPTMDNLVVEAARQFHLAANPIRLRLLLLLANGPQRFQDIAAAFPTPLRSTIGTHITALKSGELVTRYRDGSCVCYGPTERGLRMVEAFRRLVNEPARKPKRLRVVCPTPSDDTCAPAYTVVGAPAARTSAADATPAKRPQAARAQKRS